MPNVIALRKDQRIAQWIVLAISLSNYIEFFEYVSDYSTSPPQNNFESTLLLTNNKSCNFGCLRYFVFSFATRFWSFMSMNHEFDVSRDLILIHEVSE